MRRVGALAAICLLVAPAMVDGQPRPGVSGPAPSLPPLHVDSVLVAGFVATPGRASEADGEALAHALVRLLGDAGYPALYGGMEPCIRARQLAALRGIGTVVCGRLLMTTTHHEVEFMVVSPGSESGPALLREESLEALAEQVQRRVLREAPREP